MAARKELLEGDEVAQRLAHLLAVDRDHVVVHPVTCRIVPQRGGRLRDLALVVREHQIHAASVDVEAFAQVTGTHRRALHMPAGEPLSPRRRPAHDMLGRCLLPQREVIGVALVALPVQLARVGDDVVEVTTRKPAVIIFGVVFLHVEIDRAVRLVGKAVGEDLLDELDLLDDMPRGIGFDRRGLDVERIHRTVVTLRIVVRHFHRLQLLEARLLGDLVLPLVGVVLQVPHIRYVTHVTHLVAAGLQVAEHQVERHGRPGVPQVRVAVDRGAADIHAHAAGSQRFEHLLAARERIVKYEFRFHKLRKIIVQK